jgi:hypothetical protein
VTSANLANDFYLLAHDDTTGKPRLNSQALGLGLAAGLLGELLNAKRINVYGGNVLLTSHAWLADAVAQTVLTQIASQSSPLTVRTWLAYLAEQAPARVGWRLSTAGVVRVETSGVWRFKRIAYVPADLKTAAWPAVRLSLALRQREPLDEADVFLAGLAVATGLDEYLIRDAERPADVRDYLHRQLSTAWPPAHELLRHTHAVVANALVSHRL